MFSASRPSQAFHVQVGLADGERLRVDLLAEQVNVGVGVDLQNAVLGDGEHPARPAAAVVDGADDVASRLRASLSRVSSRLTISRMTSRGVKCSPGFSSIASLNLRISSSKT